MRNIADTVARIFRRSLLAIAVFALSVLPAMAQQNPDPYGLSVGVASGLPTGDIRTIVARFINGFLGLLGIIAVTLVMYAGFLWMTAKGDETQVQKAKDLLKNAVIGLIIITSAYAIAFFIIRALTDATSEGTTGCQPGQVCSAGNRRLDDIGGPGALVIQGIFPSGAGPSDGGWPKNYVVSINFNSALNPASVTKDNFIVRLCGERLNGSTPKAFDGGCGEPIEVALTREHNDSSVSIVPVGTGEFPKDFKGDYWYKVTVQGGASGVRNMEGVTLFCPIETVDISSSGVPSAYCDRAIAFNKIRDVKPPTVVIDAPASYPAQCASGANDDLTPVAATGNDDFLVTTIDFTLDASISRLSDINRNPLATATNPATPPTFPNNIFSTTTIFGDLAGLAPGKHKVSATAFDGANQTGTSEREFNVLKTSCCNAVKDADETAIDCGGTSSCGSCAGGPCTGHADCRSGYCNAQTGVCETRPVISTVNATSGGPGTLITITGSGFGSRATSSGASIEGSVVFLGDIANNNDDVIAAPCAAQAWSDNQVTIAVPSGAVDGPLKIVSLAGASDRTDDDFGSKIPNFDVTTTTTPGICYLEPSSGGPATKFAIHGSGFGSFNPTTSLLSFGAYLLPIDTCSAGSDKCGWSDKVIYSTTPQNAKESLYQVRAAIGSQTTNLSGFTLRAPVTAVPHITSIVPESGPVGTYMTIQGTGFGSRKGLVNFSYKNPNDPTKQLEVIGAVEEPVCSDYWHDTYIIVKVPATGNLGIHGITVDTAGPSRTSPEDFKFTINNAPKRPGICSIEPDNGPPGSQVTVRGEGFGNGPGVTTATTGQNIARYSVEFFKNQAKKCLISQATCTNLGAECANGGGVCAYSSKTSQQYDSWSGTQILPHVSGTLTDKTTWPESGPVFVVSNDQLSANSIKFTVQDCNATGSTQCTTGKVCCANGACQESCGPLALDSAYGWRFSTSVLPTLPEVVENRTCTANPVTLQSPSPFKDSVDACINAQVYFNFTRPLDKDSFVVGNAASTTVKVEECTGEQAATCSTPVDLLIEQFTGCGTAENANSCSAVTLQVASSYNSGLLKKDTRYRVTLISNPSTGLGLRELNSGRFLDGDFDRRQGGNYVTYFRTQNSDTPCQIKSAAVSLPKQNIADDATPVNFSAVLQAGNCNQIACNDSTPARLTWSVDTDFLSLFEPSSPYCSQRVNAVKETTPGSPTTLDLQVTPTGAPAVEGSSNITVAFDDPRIVSVFPSVGCDIACGNADIGATFNINMLSGSLSANGAVKLDKCRNASCNAPYASLGEGVTTDVAYNVGEKKVTITPKKGINTQNLDPDSYYIVHISGSVTSSSGVPLTGLNDGTTYSWKFKTKNAPAICPPARTELFPKKTILDYAGERANLTVTPFSSPDACAAAGQALVSSSFAVPGWVWAIDGTNASVQGFINKNSRFIPSSIDNAGILTATSAGTVDRAIAPNPGCSDRCLLTGSQNKIPQCGNGIVEDKFEECDGGNGCTNKCLLAGSAIAECGDGGADAGEACEKVNGVFPPGCLVPTATTNGCTFTGSSTASNAKCGDGLIQDGEACDDSNTQNGDGCSSECLHEGTNPSCGEIGTTISEANCVNFCGNKIIEVGEDPLCDLPSGIATSCDQVTCLQKNNPLKGSSSMYASPSFCGDGTVGTGEAAECDGSPVTGDSKIDPAQTVSVAHQGVTPVTIDSSTQIRAYTSKVTATVSGVPPDGVGSATVSLKAECASQADPGGYCGEIGNGAGLSLGCGLDGTCQPRPTVTQFQPTSFTACRNAEIKVAFSHVMEGTPVAGITPTLTANSIQNNFLVGVDNGTTPCSAGQQVGSVTINTNGFWSNLWHNVVGVFRDYILRPVFGAPPDQPTDTEQNHYFCKVEGTTTPTLSGQAPVGSTPDTRHTVVSFAPTNALPANKYIRVFIKPEAKSAAPTAVNIATTGFTQYFATGAKICQVSSVSVVPAYVMLPSATATETVTAHALSNQQQAIVPTSDYNWTWSWTPTSATSPIVINQLSTGAGSCSLPSVCTDPKGCNCISPLATCNVVKDAKTCTSTTTNLTAVAQISARSVSGVTGQITGPVPVEANAVFGSNSGTEIISSLTTTNSGYALVLCSDPWPKYQECGTDGKLILPWDLTDHTNECSGPAWQPFSDKATNTKFYYCRSLQKTGADATASTLPCLKETPARITQVAPGILNEYLFTFDTANCPGGPTSTGAGWADDAIGLRVSTNPEHVSTSMWYRQHGFRGNPQPTVVDGYTGLQEGRTTYVNAAGKSPSLGLFTNVNTFSYNDSAAPETVSVFGQVLNNVDFTSTPDMADIGLCRAGQTRDTALFRCSTNDDCRVDAFGKPVASQKDYVCNKGPSVCQRPEGATFVDVYGIGTGVSCNKDLDCRLDSSGTPVLGRTTGFCDVPKTKLVRDVKRWADLQFIRNSAITKLNSTGKVPTLDAGSFVRGRTVSAWPSWSATFASELGAPAPTDPLNAHGVCDATGTDKSSCWNVGTGTYINPMMSHVYGYESNGPTNFTLSSDFEYGQTESGTRPVWSGSTCIEKTTSGICVADGTCEWNSATNKCNFKIGKVILTSNAGPFTTPATSASTFGPGRCGDGVINIRAACAQGVNCEISEACEPGNTKVDPCTKVVSGTSRTGSQTFSCTASCAWGSPTECLVGECGDGVIQAPEVCDDANDNGKYGFCNASCTARGFMCGDGTVQPGEKCDCAEKNGQYYKNGILANFKGFCDDGANKNNICNSDSECPNAACVEPSNQCGTGIGTGNRASVPSCSWDCGAAGPRCGDGIKNGTDEECDGGSEEFKGYCSTSTKIGCNTDANCPAGQTCGGFCKTVEEKNRHYCQPNDTSHTTEDYKACHWSEWTCTSAGSCGNAKTETGEQCDDGNKDDTDACTSDCRLPVCGDGKVQPAAAEFCDEGSRNGTVCTPEYGKSCTYCTPSCKTASRTGAFCGDSAIQNRTTQVKGPEECEGSRGLGGYICVSSELADQSKGKVVPSPSCSQDACQRQCPSTSTLCKNDTNIVSIAPMKYPAGASMARKLAQIIYTGVDKEDNTPVDKGVAAVSPFQIGGAGIASLFDSLACSPSDNPSNAEESSNGNRDNDALSNQCDPDDDDDGVPDGYDCEPMYCNAHGAYSLGGHSIRAAAEACDGLDNDCNGETDNIYKIKGTVINARTGDPLGNAKFSLHCNTADGATIVTDTSNDRGIFNVEALIGLSCAKLVVVPENNSFACGDPDDQVEVSVASLTRCVEKDIGKIVAVPKPGSDLNPGVGTVFLQWGSQTSQTAPPSDIDLHVKDSAGQHLFYNGTTAIDEMTWDHDNISTSIYPGSRLETVSFKSYDANRSYRFYMNNCCSTNDWGSKSAVVKFFNSSCVLKSWKVNAASGSGTDWNVFTIKNGTVTEQPNSLGVAPGNP